MLRSAPCTRPRRASSAAAAPRESVRLCRGGGGLGFRRGGEGGGLGGLGEQQGRRRAGQGQGLRCAV